LVFLKMLSRAIPHLLVSGGEPRDPVIFRQDNLFNLFFYIILFGIIGGRLVHILSFAKYYSQNLLEIFYIWNGGIAFYGVFISGLLVLFYFSKNIKNFLIFADAAIIGLSLAQSIGRWGNYFNQELFGKHCDYFFCVPIQNLSGHFHPVFLYESILMLLVFIILLFIFNKKYIIGLTSSLYLILHAIIRFFLEFLRLDIQPEFLNLRLFQYLAILELIVGIILLVFVKKWYNKKVISN